MASGTSTRKIIKDVIIVGCAIGILVTGLVAAFGTYNPFYVVASGSMVPTLETHDLLVISAHVDFEEIVPGDIIVFNRPSDHDRVIVHRIVSVINEDPWTLRAKGDANPASIAGTDFPITQEEYLGKVVYVIPDVGFLPKLIQPPINYIIIAGIVGFIIAKQLKGRNKPKPDSDADIQTKNDDDDTYTKDKNDDNA